jgi:hypothetical protein
MAKVEIRQIDNSSMVNMTVNRFMLQLELPTSAGNLWDDSVTCVEWGHVDTSGRLFGQVIPRNGKPRQFFDPALITPYLNAFHAEAERQGHIDDAGQFTSRMRPTQNS